MQKNNLVQFPDADERFTRILLKANPVVDDCVDQIMTTMIGHGYDVGHPNCLNQYQAMVESIFSLMLKSQGETP